MTRADRPDPVELLATQHATRVPELVPVRWGRMAQSPLAFLRGAALVMADDLAHTPTTGLTVQACGDAHLSNFGGFASPERREVFDLNDFDETLVGPWEWDVKRLAASVAVAARELGAKDTTAGAAVDAAIRGYANAMTTLAELPVLDVWYFQIEVERSILPLLRGRLRRKTTAALERMRHRTSRQVFARATEVSEGGRRIREDPPLVTHEGLGAFDHEIMQAFITRYVQSLPPERAVLLRRFVPVDVARKVVGVGSVGTRCYIVLLLGPEDEPLFLQIKEAPPSVLEPYCGSFPGSGGERVVTGQRQMQATSDIFLGWSGGPDRDFYVRQLRDMKHSVDLVRLGPDGLLTYVAFCGATLARAHARTGDPAAIAGYLGRGAGFGDALRSWALAYADQTQADHARLLEAIHTGEIHAQLDV